MYKNKTGVLTVQDLEDAAQRAAANFGAPDMMMLPSGVYRMSILGMSGGTSETCAKIRKYFMDINMIPENDDLKDFHVMNAAAKAFRNIDLDKDEFPLGYSITLK